MCGIVGYIGSKDALNVIVSGLERLEYRGYDSAGVALYVNGKVEVTRALGKLCQLKEALNTTKPQASAHIGIGHTRWATHGRPSENNAHPHTAGRVSLIHNGIIENYLELREELLAKGSKFKSETDTEIAAHLLNYYLEEGLEPFEALEKTCSRIRGSYAFLAIDADNADRILVAKNATPIVVGIGEKEAYIASDIPAILDHIRDICILEDGDLAEIKAGSIRVVNGGKEVERTPQKITWDPVTAQKGGFKHYMLKEIHEQVESLTNSFRTRLRPESGEIILEELAYSAAELKGIKRVVFVAAGSAYIAGLMGKFYFEQFLRIPCEVDYASEFRYRDQHVDPDTLVIAISQSGETADTLGAVGVAAGKTKTLSICNVLGSSLTRKVDNTIYIHAGPEISVCSTKAFTSQVIVTYLLALYLGDKLGVLSTNELQRHIDGLVHLPTAVAKVLKDTSLIEDLAKKHHGAKDFLYLGRGLCFPIALEGALKLKEISYIHAEGYPAGEMKHGPLALVDENLPVVIVLQKSERLYEKALSNLKEVESRGGKIIVVTDEDNDSAIRDITQDVVVVPHINEFVSPIVLMVPLQLLAYYIAVQNGTDVDLPRNLAKSVTVE